MIARGTGERIPERRGTQSGARERRRPLSPIQHHAARTTFCARRRAGLPRAKSDALANSWIRRTVESEGPTELETFPSPWTVSLPRSSEKLQSETKSDQLSKRAKYREAWPSQDCRPAEGPPRQFSRRFYNRNRPPGLDMDSGFFPREVENLPGTRTFLCLTQDLSSQIPLKLSIARQIEFRAWRGGRLG